MKPEHRTTADHDVAIDPTAVMTRSARAKTLLGGMVGNFIEFLDFATYGLVASILATQFFSEQDETAALLSTFVVYAASFVIRPLGGIVLGRIGDRVGRVKLLALTVLGMSLSTAAMGLLPTYAQIGVAAPLLLTLCRLGQGFFVGAEFATATSFLVESSSPKRRAYWATWSTSSAYVGSVAGLLLFTGLSYGLSEAAMQSWGWRLLFLLAVPLGVGAAFIRWRLEETQDFKAIQRLREQRVVQTKPLGYVIRRQWKQILSFMSLHASHSLPDFLVVGFLVTYLTVFIGQPVGDAAIALLVARIVLVFTTIGAGAINDRIGRRNTAILGCLVVIPTIFVAFSVARIGTLTSAIVAAVLMVFSYPLMSSVMVVGLVEMFPADVRITAGSLAYNVSTGLFGGTAPLIASFLVGAAFFDYAVPVYVACVAVMSLISVLVSFSPGPRTDDIALDRATGHDGQLSEGASR